ncbi:glycosyltransferase family 4 protein [Streptomyces olivaceus]|uniref:glycosyltransferase family 4 protein n=1 Tax=Streptomyces olivaceus TaxID=47716 RepID=UPI0033A5AC44
MRLLLVGQGRQESGYARVLRSLAPFLADYFDTRYFHVNTRSALSLRGVECVAPTLISDPFGTIELPDVLSQQAPDVLLACHDADVLGHYAQLVRRYRSQTHLVLYVPLEWADIPEDTLAGLALADVLVCYTEAARKWLADRLDTVSRPSSPRIRVLPHGVDLQTFGPIGPAGRVARSALTKPQRRFLARQLLGLPEDGLIILNANRDTPRKRLDATVHAYAEVLRRRPDVRLILTHGSRHRALVRELGLSRYVILPDMRNLHDETLNLYYNSADIGINTATAEGWGLVALEHAAAGAAQVMPRHPALLEIWGRSATFVPCERSSIAGYGCSSPIDHASAILALLTEPHRREQFEESTQRVASSLQLSWKSIAERWVELLIRP